MVALCSARKCSACAAYESHVCGHVSCPLPDRSHPRGGPVVVIWRSLGVPVRALRLRTISGAASPLQRSVPDGQRVLTIGSRREPMRRWRHRVPFRVQEKALKLAKAKAETLFIGYATAGGTAREPGTLYNIPKLPDSERLMPKPEGDAADAGSDRDSDALPRRGPKRKLNGRMRGAHGAKGSAVGALVLDGVGAKPPR